MPRQQHLGSVNPLPAIVNLSRGRHATAYLPSPGVFININSRLSQPSTTHGNSIRARPSHLRPDPTQAIIPIGYNKRQLSLPDDPISLHSQFDSLCHNEWLEFSLVNSSRAVHWPSPSLIINNQTCNVPIALIITPIFIPNRLSLNKTVLYPLSCHSQLRASCRAG